MEQEIIDVFSEEKEVDGIEYATFWRRLGASLLDGLILFPVGYVGILLSMVYYKIYILSLLPVCISLGYKIYLEKKYGQTLGKKITGIKVTSDDFQSINYTQAIKRNYYQIIMIFMTAASNLNLFSMAAFQQLSTYMEVAQFQAANVSVYKYLSYALAVLYIIDCLLMYRSEQKKTIHDGFGNTVVIKIKA